MDVPGLVEARGEALPGTQDEERCGHEAALASAGEKVGEKAAVASAGEHLGGALGGHPLGSIDLGAGSAGDGRAHKRCGPPSR